MVFLLKLFLLQFVAAIVAEFTASGGFAAIRADGGFAFKLSRPYRCGLSGLVNVAAHCLCPRLRYIDLF
jgi:hypothetical protein